MLDIIMDNCNHFDIICFLLVTFFCFKTFQFRVLFFNKNATIVSRDNSPSLNHKSAHITSRLQIYLHSYKPSGKLKINWLLIALVSEKTGNLM